MGIFSKLFGGGVNKSALVRDLALHRIRTDPMAAAFGIDAGMIKALSGIQLMGLPEGTVVTIVESWATMRKSGAPEKEIFDLIEAHRSIMFPPGDMPTPPTLTSYIKYRLALEAESAGVALLEDEYVEHAITKAREAYET